MAARHNQIGRTSASRRRQRRELYLDRQHATAPDQTSTPTASKKRRDRLRRLKERRSPLTTINSNNEELTQTTPKTRAIRTPVTNSQKTIDPLTPNLHHHPRTADTEITERVQRSKPVGVGTPTEPAQNRNSWAALQESLRRFRHWKFPPPTTATPRAAINRPSLRLELSWNPSHRGSPRLAPPIPSNAAMIEQGTATDQNPNTDTVAKQLTWEEPSSEPTPPTDDDSDSSEEDEAPLQGPPMADDPETNDLDMPPTPPLETTPDLLNADGTIKIIVESERLGLLLNVWSLPKHRFEIRDLITLHKPDVILLTETWLSDDENPILKVAIPPNYNAFTANRGARAGGVGIFTKQEITCSRDDSYKIAGCEHILIKCTFDSTTSRSFLLIYRPPKRDTLFPDILADAAADILIKHPNLIILGDLNIWVDTPSAPMSKNLSNNMEALNLKRGIHESTHKDGHWLDGIYHRTGQITVGRPIWIPWTDHKMIPFTIPVTTVPKQNTVMSSMARNWKKLENDDRLIPTLLSCTPPNFQQPALQPETFTFPNLTATSLSAHIRTFDAWITQGLDTIIPKRKLSFRKQKKAPWFNDTLRNIRKNMRRHLLEWRKNRSKENLLNFKLAMKHYRAASLNTRRAYFSTRVENAPSASRELFRIIEDHNKDRNHTEENDTKEFCNTMARHFMGKEQLLHRKITTSQSKSTSANVDQGHQPSHTNLPTLATFEPLSWQDFKNIISKAKTAGSQDDPCPSHIYKKLMTEKEIGDILRRIINSSLILGIVPPEYKNSQVRALLKKANLDPSDSNNYRGITRSRFPPKITEKVVTSQFSSHIESNNILNCSQGGFRANHSTETILLAITDNLKKQVDSTGAAALILLDLSAAFDTVEHKTLLDRLEAIGIKGTAKDWVRSFLSSRILSVSTAQHSSDSFTPLFGVPQGSPLSPLLFNVYLSPLIEIIHRHNLTCFNYADDTQILLKISHDNPQEFQPFEPCMQDVIHWMNQNHLLINPEKTEILICKTNHTPTPSISWPADFGSQPQPTNAVLSLGLIIDKDLNCLAQVKKTSKTCFHIMRCLRHILPLLAYPQQVTAINALILSRLDYANSTLAGTSIKCIKILQRTQNAAARMLTRAKPWEHITPSLTSLRWLPISRRITFKTLCLTHQAVNNKGPAFLNSLIAERPPPRNLRSSNTLTLQVPRRRTRRLRESTFSYQGPQLWNSMPQQLQHVTNYKSFKKAIKHWLFINQADAYPYDSPNPTLDPMQ